MCAILLYAAHLAVSSALNLGEALSFEIHIDPLGYQQDTTSLIASCSVASCVLPGLQTSFMSRALIYLLLDILSRMPFVAGHICSRCCV